MKKVYDAVATTGKYTDRTSGKEKSRYLTVGAVFVNDKGQYSLKLEALPLGDFNGWISFYEPRERSAQKPQETPPAVDDFGDQEIPF
jgi:hypothetical protein